MRVALWLLCTSCVVVSSPTIDESDDAATTTASEIPEAAFPVYWAVEPASVPVPSGSDAIAIDHGVYVISGVSLGDTPASVADPEAKYEELAAAIEAAVPVDVASGLGVIINLWWEVPWCTVPDVDRELFAMSSLGEGLEGDALGAAWEEAGAAIHLGLLARARTLRPQLQWGIAGLPRANYSAITTANQQVVHDERECTVLDPSLAPVWDAVDVVVPIARMWYTGLDADRIEENRLYVQRYVEGARLVGKPTIPLFEGRYVRSSASDTNPYMSLPILADDVAVFVEASRQAGAAGFIYNLNADSCWNFEAGCEAENPDDFEVLFEDYWRDVFVPVLSD